MTPVSGIDITVEGIAVICRKYKVRQLGFFDSVARGEATPQSDIDILLEFLSDSGMSLFQLEDLSQELEQLLGRKVDLVSKRGLKPRVRPYVMRDLRIVYEA